VAAVLEQLRIRNQRAQRGRADKPNARSGFEALALRIGLVPGPKPLLDVIPELDYPDVSAGFVVMAALEAAIQKNISSYDWMAGSSPVMTVGREFANVFMASSVSGNMG
jgi:hypothetical protein